MSETLWTQIDPQTITHCADGQTAKCYRLPDGRLLKLYEPRFDSSYAKSEFNRARFAWEAGIVTPKAHFAAQCGDRYGVVFDFLENSTTMTRALLAQPERAEELATMYADICKAFHACKADLSRLPDERVHYIEAVKALDIASTQVKDTLIEIILSLPEHAYCLHGDLHSNNILMVEGKPYIIDLGDMGYGISAFDTGLPYSLYCLGAHDGSSELIFGMDGAMAEHFYELFEARYYGISTPDDRARMRDIAAFFRFLRLIYIYRLVPNSYEKLKNSLLRDCFPNVEHWRYLSEEVGALS